MQRNALKYDLKELEKYSPYLNTEFELYIDEVNYEVIKKFIEQNDEKFAYILGFIFSGIRKTAVFKKEYKSTYCMIFKSARFKKLFPLNARIISKFQGKKLILGDLIKNKKTQTNDKRITERMKLIDKTTYKLINR